MSGKRYLLMVDDEQNILKALKREFADWAYLHGLEILTAPLAQEALAMLEEHGANTVIVVSDLKMPGMKGSDFLLQVRATWPHIVTVLLTGYSETEEIVKAVRAGIFSYILKPWDSEYLLAEINKALENFELRASHENHTKTLEAQLRLAGELQKSILKPSVPASDKVEFRVTYRPTPALQCGGDYYDVIPLGSDRYFLLLGHVSAAGIQAAMITAILKAVIFPEYVRAIVGNAISPADFLSWLNQRMNFELRQTTGIAITFFAGYLDARIPSFQYANAGAPHPVILRAAHATELPVSGSPFSVSNSILYKDQMISLQTGDVITLYSGGLLGVEPEFPEAPPPGAVPPAIPRHTRASTDTLKPTDIFGAIPWGPAYHHSILDKALELRQGREFPDHLTILTLRIT